MTGKKPWFKPWGWLYQPVRWPAWLVVILAAAFSLHLFRFFDAHSHSATDTLYRLFPYLVPTWLLVDWVARRTTEGEGRGRGG